MNTLPNDLECSHLWRTTLAERSDDPESQERGRLRAVFLQFRRNTIHLATEIRRDIPSLTVHDVTHLDALWEVASTIVGDTYALTPTEGFVLGGAILLHDLAMSVAATEGGYHALIKDPRWADIVTYHYRASLDRSPTTPELADPEPAILSRALFEFLRQVHAENASRLAFLSYPTTDASPIFLIEDTEVRQTFGKIIGTIAHSHWWSLNEVEKQFGRVLGPPAWCPRTWTVDPLKVACILRVADAAHLDARRAPTFLKAFTSLAPSSEQHWRFQERLARPYLRTDALVFTSSQPFELNDAGAWWLCLEALRAVDRELRGVDAVFSDKGHPRFAARHVAGVDHPERLASYVQPAGWFPIHATVQVSDLPQVIRSLGGEALYGMNPQVPLRELIQNACDAVRARRTFEGRGPAFGSVTVSLIEKTADDCWLEVSDTGVGMSQRVLTDFLLDFGKSFWGSPQMQEEFPGLLAADFRSTGKYGVGFFSVFMVAQHVQVITRRADAAAADTLVLEFSSGLQGRPILRPASRQERLIDGGTRIRISLKDRPRTEGGLLHDRGREVPLCSLVRELALAVDVDIVASENASESIAVTANDWQTIPGAELLERTGPSPFGDNYGDSDREVQEAAAIRARAGHNLRVIRDASGAVFGRACITVGYAGDVDMRPDVGGTVSVGGLTACRLTGIGGVLFGEPARASRDGARPLVPADVLKHWAEEQADLVPGLWPDPEDQSACAQYVRMCGGDTRGLPIAQYRGAWISADRLRVEGKELDSAVIVDTFAVRHELKHLAALVLNDNVFVTRASGWPGLLQSGPRIPWPLDLDTKGVYRGGHAHVTLAGAVAEALFESWALNPRTTKESIRLEAEREVHVGDDGDRKIFVRAFQIERPKSTPVSS